MTRLRLSSALVLSLVLVGVTLHAQTAPAAGPAPAIAVNGASSTGQTRGIRAVTRRTLMLAPGQEARGLFTAGGVDLGGSPASSAVTAPSAAPVVAETKLEGLDRPEVQRALRQLAAAGDADAKRLLAASRAQTAAAKRPAR